LHDEYLELWKEIYIHQFIDGRTGTEYRKERFEKLLKKFNVEDKELVNHLLKLYDVKLAEKTVPYAETLSVLEKLSKKYTLLIATGGPEDSQNYVIGLLGITHFFKKIYTASKTRKTKVDGGMFKHILEELRLKPTEVLVVGDSFIYDVVGAHMAGIKAIWFNTMDEKRPAAEFDYKEISNLDELLLLLL
jgi:putative hydrolase of the HAD superfamily